MNFVWSSQANGKARAKVAWDTAILPLAKGGINIFDLEAKITTILTKMFIKDFTPWPKPWKVLLCHQVHNLKQSYKGRWHTTT
jgi:hypothetical protein